MGSSFWDTISNLIRTPLDFLHFFIYVLFMYIAVLYAFYKFDKKFFTSHGYEDYAYHAKRIRRAIFMRIKYFFRKTFLFIWTPISNRLPYITKILKSIQDRFFK